MHKLAKYFLIIACSLLTACGGGGGSSSSDVANDTSNNQSPPDLLTGVFIDAVVANIAYRTESQSGFTNDLGEFSYVEGESVIFSIGDIDFPEVIASAVVTPLEIVDTDFLNDRGLLNILRLLQSLDDDGDLNNGILISEAAHLSASGIESIDFNDLNFENTLNNLLVDLGKTWVSADDALDHFADSLAQQNIEVAPTQFSLSWLRGKTLYQVSHEDQGEGNPNMFVYQLTFNESTVDVTGILNTDDDYTTSYTVSESGQFSYDIEDNEYYVMLCNDSTEYYRAAYVRGNERPISGESFVNLFYLDRDEALSAAGSTETAFSLLPCENPIVNNSVTGVWQLSLQNVYSVGGELLASVTFDDTALAIVLPNSYMYAAKDNSNDLSVESGLSFYQELLDCQFTQALVAQYGDGNYVTEGFFANQHLIERSDNQFIIKINTGDQGAYDLDVFYERVSLSGSPIVGAWLLVSPVTQAANKTMLLFLDDGRYVGVQPYDQNGHVGSEWGNYTLTGTSFSATQTQNNDGEALLSDVVVNSLVIEGDLMTMNTSAGVYVYQRQL